MHPPTQIRCLQPNPYAGLASLLSGETQKHPSRFELKRRYPGDYNYREFYRDIGYDLDSIISENISILQA